MNYIFDTSALLSLQSADLLDLTLKNFTIHTTLNVLKELEDFAQHSDSLGEIAKSVLTQKSKLIIKSVQIKQHLPHISQTDNELYNLALATQFPLITDDIKLTKHAKTKTAFSTLFLFLYLDAEILTKKQALEKLETVRNLRNWQNNIIYLNTKQHLEQQ